MTNFFNKRQSAGQTVNSAQEDEIVSAIKNSLNVAEPDDMRLQRMLRKIEAKKGSPKKPFLHWPRIAAVAALAVLVFSAGALISRSNLPANKDHVANIIILQQALAAVKEPDMVTYYKIDSIGRETGENKLMDYETVEIWLSPKADKVKYVERAINPIVKPNQPTQTGYVFVTDGNRIAEANEWDGRIIDAREVAAKDPGLESMVGPHIYLLNTIKQYSILLEEKKLKVVGEERIDDIDTYRLEPTVVRLNGGIPEINNGQGISEINVVNIRKDDYRPVRVIHYPDPKTYLKSPPAIADALNPPPGIYEVTSMFEKVKLIEASNLGMDFFSLANEIKDRDYRLDATYSVDEAKRFDKFDLYWLGNLFEDHKLDATDSIHYYYVSKAPLFPEEPKGATDPENVWMRYKNLDGENKEGFSLSVFPKLSTSQEVEWLKKGSVTILSETRVQVGDSSATLFEGHQEFNSPGSDGYTAALYMNKGGVTIGLTGDDKDLLLKAAENLKKLN